MTPNTTSTTADLVYTVGEIAEKLKISQWMVNKLIREKTLHSIQIGARRLVPATDLEEYLRGLRKEGRGIRHGQ
jgi:excisionase family DNA binding protein